MVIVPAKPQGNLTGRRVGSEIELRSGKRRVFEAIHELDDVQRPGQFEDELVVGRPESGTKFGGAGETEVGEPAQLAPPDQSRRIGGVEIDGDREFEVRRVQRARAVLAGRDGEVLSAIAEALAAEFHHAIQFGTNI